MTGSGPLVVLSHGIGVGRQDYRFLALMLRADQPVMRRS